MVDCGCTPKEIMGAIRTAQMMIEDNILQNEKNPYEGKNTSENIINIIKKHLETGIDIKKCFYDIK